MMYINYINIKEQLKAHKSMLDKNNLDSDININIKFKNSTLLVC